MPNEPSEPAPSGRHAAPPAKASGLSEGLGVSFIAIISPAAILGTMVLHHRQQATERHATAKCDVVAEDLGRRQAWRHAE